MQQRQQFSGLDDMLQAIHSSDVQKLTARHVAMVIHGKAYTEADRVPSEHRKVLHVDKFDFGKLYAASIMYGYFLANVQQRFQLEKRFLMENSGVYQKDYEAFSLESYMALQGAETLHRWSCIRSSHALQIIDQHCTILFGKYPFGPHIEQVPFGDAEMTIHLSYVKILTYQALAFGALLWDVQHNFTPLYPHVCGVY
ncbi:hypothetical protein KP509_09G000900 [Ceratopteris richardii]|nr:hypothetical protein KP509_09G000900 [Ceratopteris richardii]